MCYTTPASGLRGQILMRKWGVDGWMLMVNDYEQATGQCSLVIYVNWSITIAIYAVYMQVYNSYMYTYVSTTMWISYTYVCTYIMYTWLAQGENVHGIQCRPAQMFYGILKQPSELHHTHATLGTTPVMMSTWMAKHTTLYNRGTNTTHYWLYICVEFLNSSVVVVPVRPSLKLV